MPGSSTPAIDATADARRARRVIWGCLLLAAALRLWLVVQGGQYFWADETRYLAAQEAAADLAAGRVREALTVPVGQGDHVGFKLLMIGPALAARMAGVDDPRWPAGFVAACSWATLWLVWGVARRLGFSPAAQAWAVALATASGSLLVYARHLLPYDIALALALAALWVGWKSGFSLARALGAGALAGASLLVYFGYWPLAGVVIGLLGARAGLAPAERVARWAAAGCGAAMVLAAVLLIDRWGAGTLLANARAFSTTVSQGDFGHGHRLLAEYFWAADGLPVLAFLLGLAGLLRPWRVAGSAAAAAPEARWLLGLAVLALAGGLVIASDVLRKFVVYGRTARELTPFLCLAGGLALAELLGPRARAVRVFAAVLLAGAGGWQLAVPLAQVFPRDFKREGDRRLAVAPAAEPGLTYYRYVNVEHYMLGPESVPDPVRATLLIARHPYQYAPFLYEGFSAEQRAQRRAADQRMRLILAEVPADRRVQGEPAGQVRLRVRLAPDRTGLVEPLLAVGEPGSGLLFFVRRLEPGRIVCGVERVARDVTWGQPLEIDPAAEHDFAFYAGELGGVDGPAGTAVELYYRGLLAVRVDDRVALQREVEPAAAPVTRPSAQLQAGFNLVRSGSALTAFAGEIREVRRGGLPPLPAELDPARAAGPLRLRVRLSGLATGRAEPLAVVGEPGRAQLAYLRELPGGQIRLGIEIWGVGVVESEPVAIAADEPLDLEWRFPALCPPDDDPWWAETPAAARAAARRHFFAAVGGVTVLDREQSVPAASGEVHLGRNPLGGSWVEPEFRGRILQVTRPGPAGFIR